MMFRAKDRAAMQMANLKLDTVQGHLAGCTTAWISGQLKALAECQVLLSKQMERIELGQSVLKADLDAAQVVQGGLAHDEVEFRSLLLERLAAIEKRFDGGVDVSLSTEEVRFLARRGKSRAKPRQKRSKK